MTAAKAIIHERSSIEHQRNVSNPDLVQWFSQGSTSLNDWVVHPEPAAPAKSLQDLKDRDQGVGVASEVVHYWRHAMLAAEKGEDLKLESYLEVVARQRESGGWGAETVEAGGWAYQAGAWGANIDHKSMSSASANGHRTISEAHEDNTFEWETGHADAHGFVEDIARDVAADARRKRQMHIFYQVDFFARIHRPY